MQSILLEPLKETCGIENMPYKICRPFSKEVENEL
jgi:hypothetical protein